MWTPGIRPGKLELNIPDSMFGWFLFGAYTDSDWKTACPQALGPRIALRLGGRPSTMRDKGLPRWQSAWWPGSPLHLTSCRSTEVYSKCSPRTSSESLG